MRKKIYNEILDRQKYLRPLTSAQIQWCHSHYKKVAYCNSRNLAWCQSCGYEEKKLPELLALDMATSYVCPRCGKRLELEKKTGKHHCEKYYHTIATTIAGWQVFRTFLAERNNIRGLSTQYYLNEVYQIWIDEAGREYILSIGYHRSPLYGEKWEFSLPLDKPRKHNASYTSAYALYDTFNIAGNFFYPRSSFTAQLKRNGWRNHYTQGRLNCAEVCKALLSSPDMEMIAKTQPRLFEYLMYNEIKDFPFVHSVKICNRKGYIIEPDLWCDYLEQLQELGLDTHNAYYVCPADIKAAHCIMQKRINRLREKRIAEEEKAHILELEKAYSKHIMPYKGLLIQGDGIVIFPLCSVQAIYDEGKAMHHCVYSGEYYKKKDILLLSACTEGRRLETIELSLKDFSVLQSRGKCNQNTPQHNNILNLINNNKSKIEECQKKSFLFPAR